jgi:RimJ/RimL family protein N-acetyltransferase
VFARTKRLMLRPGWPEDAAALTQAIAHERVAMMLARVPWPYTQADAETFLAVPRGSHEPRFLIETLEQGAPRLVGGIGLARDGGVHELGYWLTPDAWGRGYATEAGKAMLGMARHALGLKQLRSSYFLDNPASGEVLAKLGFQHIGEKMLHSVARGCEAPCAMVALDLAEEDRASVFRLAA